MFRVNSSFIVKIVSLLYFVEFKLSVFYNIKYVNKIGYRISI